MNRKDKDHKGRQPDHQSLLLLQVLTNLLILRQDLLDHLLIEMKHQIKYEQFNVQLIEEKNQNNKVDLEVSQSTAALPQP